MKKKSELDKGKKEKEKDHEKEYRRYSIEVRVNKKKREGDLLNKWVTEWTSEWESEKRVRRERERGDKERDRILVLKVMRRIGRSTLPTKVKVWTLVHLRVYTIRKKKMTIARWKLITWLKASKSSFGTCYASFTFDNAQRNRRVHTVYKRYEWKGYFYKIDRKEMYAILVT